MLPRVFNTPGALVCGRLRAACPGEERLWASLSPGLRDQLGGDVWVLSARTSPLPALLCLINH